MDPSLGRMAGLVLERSFFPSWGQKKGRRYFHATKLPLGIDEGRPITPILDLGDSYDEESKGKRQEKKKKRPLR